MKSELNIQKTLQVLNAATPETLTAVVIEANESLESYDIFNGEEIQFGLYYYLEDKSTVLDFWEEKQLLDFSKTFLPESITQITEVYTSIRNLITEYDLNAEFPAKETFESFIEHFYYDRPYYYYSLLSSFDELNKSGVYVSCNYEIKDNEIKTTFSLTFEKNKNSYNYSYEEQEQLYKTINSYLEAAKQ